MAMFCGASVPCYDTTRNVTQLAAGDEVAAYAAGAPAVLLRGFGAASAGRTVREAVARAWLLEQGARATLTATAAGDPQPYDPEAAAPFSAAEGPAAGQVERLWRYLHLKHPGADGR
jgi:HCOMODA/2-hydroxy-3-carboxy-muconic semialdehyde decarboxylase